MGRTQPACCRGSATTAWNARNGGWQGPPGRKQSLMSDTDGKKTLGLRSGSRPGNVKQSFSHGRTKNVVVETKRKRVVVPKPGAGKASGGAGGSSPAGDPSRRPAGIT